MNHAEKFLIEHKNDGDKIAVIVNAGGLELIDNIRVNKPAMDHIIEYVKDGWNYTKVNSTSAL